MAEGPLVSVIIPTFNRCEMVKAAIASVLGQSYHPFECIVVDDGSTDSTAAVLKEMFSSRIRLFSKSNAGVSSARNLGIHQAKGDFIAFLDSDDVWLRDKLTRQMEYFRLYPESLICQTTEQWMRKGRRVNPPDTHKKKAGDIFQESLERCMVTPSSVMIRRPLLEEVGLFDEAMPVCEDYDLWLRITCKYEVELVPEELLVRNGGRPDQLSASHSMDKYRVYALGKLLASGLLNQHQKKAALKTFREKGTIYANGCMKRGKEEEAQQTLLQIEQMEKSA